jgi:hypothetical protein
MPTTPDRQRHAALPGGSDGGLKAGPDESTLVASSCAVSTWTARASTLMAIYAMLKNGVEYAPSCTAADSLSRRYGATNPS